ncbi:MAG: alkyl sulfatase dimerization domain-containing protein [Myxococcota bacterium]
MADHNPVQKFLENRDADPDEAQFFWSGGPLKVAERTWFQSLLSGTTAFDTDEGLVLVDTGAKMFAPTFAQQLRQLTGAPVHTAIYTHGHVDHAFGLDAFLLPDQDRPRVVAHPAALARFERYARTARHNRFINARQFGGTADAEGFDLFEHPSVMPNELCEDRATLRVGGLTFELRHCRGETDDHLWVWCPERGVLCPGDLFIYAVPNAGNPQKAQRYPWDWAAGLREMAACRPRVLCPGHGGPVVDDPDKIQRMLTETADYLDLLVERTIQAMENGSPPHVDIVREVEPPATSSPWLQPVYDEAEFIVRNVIRHFGGWWSGRPSELKPASRDRVAGEMVALAGGVRAVVDRARALADDGDLQLASHLADYALEAAPEDGQVQEAVARIYEARARSERSLMAINLFNSAAEYARSGRPFR